MTIVWAIAIYRKASLPRLIAMQRRVLAETMIEAAGNATLRLRLFRAGGVHHFRAGALNADFHEAKRCNIMG